MKLTSFLLIRLQFYKCLNYFCFKRAFLLKFLYYDSVKEFLHLKIMVKSQKIAIIPEVVVSFLESINLIPPKQKLLNIFFWLLYTIFFQKRETKFDFRFTFFLKEETQKNGKTKNDFRFIVLCTKKHKNRRTKIDFRLIVFPFMYEQTQKAEKRKMTSVLSLFVFLTNKHNRRKKKGNRLPFFLLCTSIVFRSLVFPLYVWIDGVSLRARARISVACG